MVKLHPVQYISIRYNKCKYEYDVIFYRLDQPPKQYFPTWGTVSLLIDVLNKLKNLGLVDISPRFYGWFADVRKYTLHGGEE